MPESVGPMPSILFDLDGTLVDSRRGILTCLHYALGTVGAVPPKADVLANFIGNPLHATFAQLLCGYRKSDAVAALNSYRSKYAAEGLYESSLYPGVPEVLSDIKKKRWRAFIVTGKPVGFARRMIRHFHLTEYLAGVYGSYLDGRFERKDALICRVLEKERLLRHRTIMVGDRRNDVDAARQNRIDSIGVSYGYGSAAELRTAGPRCICASPRSVLDALVVWASR